MRWIVFFITLVLLTGCRVPWSQTVTEVEEGCTALPQQERDVCYREQAVEQNDAHFCRAILAIAQREACFMELAEKTCDATLCDALALSRNIMDCQQRVEHSMHCDREVPALPVAVPAESDTDVQEDGEEGMHGVDATGDLPEASDDPDDICGVLRGDQRDFCYQQAALDTGDATLCEQVVGERFAGMESNPARDKCYFMLAVTQCTPVLCEQVTGKQLPFTTAGCQQRTAQECP